MPVYNAAADSSVGAATDDAVVSAVRLSRPGLHRHTGPHRLHELFIGYEQVTAWVARFSFKLEANYHQTAVFTGWLNKQAHKSPPLQFWLTSNRQLEGTIGQVADTAHTGSFITRRSHLNLLWIYIMLSTPMIYKLCRFISWSNMKSFKPTP